MSENPTTLSGDQAAPHRRRWGRAWFGLFGLLLLLTVFTGWVAWQAQDVEARILREIQPHLATDVHIDELEVSLWAAWPDVQVQLQAVRIADALDPEADFMTMDQVDLRVACWPLLEGQLEVKSFGLSGGRVSVRHTADGRGNWTFWKEQDGAESGLSNWRIDALSLDAVTIHGDWSGAEDRIQWVTTVEDASLALALEAEGDVSCNGALDLVQSRLQVAGETWLEAVDLESDISGRISGEDVSLTFAKAELGRSGEAVELDAEMEVVQGRFGLSLSAPGAAWSAVTALMPPTVQLALSEGLSRLRGKAGLEGLVGSGNAASLTRWAGPESEDWTQAWAVRADLSGTRVVEQGQAAAIQSGVVVAHATRGGWRAESGTMRAAVAGGEVEFVGDVEGDGRRWSLDVDGQGWVRPAGLVAWASPAVTWPEGWSLTEEGQIRADGRMALRSGGQGGVSWEISNGAKCSAEGVRWLGTEGELKVGALEVRAEGDGWSAVCSDVRAPGVSGASLKARQQEEGQLDLVLDGLEVAPFLKVWNDWSPAPVWTGGSGTIAPWNVTVECGPVRYSSLRADRMEVQGRWSSGRFVIHEMEADAMGGQLEGTGVVDDLRVDFDGRMTGVDLPSFMEATDGLGQSTLLPRHVRGRTWAKGHVGYAFRAGSAQPWDAQVIARVEEGELIEFDLLQEIPSALEADRKSRLIADVDDLRRRLRRVRFEPLVVEVEFKRDVLTLEPAMVESDAMDLGVEGWYRLGGRMDFTLDFALRDLKSEEGELGTMEEDGLGHRFFLAVGGTLDAPEFGYDRQAHQSHRREQRQGAWNRLKNVLQGEEGEDAAGEGVREAPTPSQPAVEVNAIAPADSVRAAPHPEPAPFVDDDDDF